MDAAPPTRPRTQPRTQPRTRPRTRPNTGPRIADRKAAFRRFAIGSACFGVHILSVAAFLLMVTVGGLHWLLAAIIVTGAATPFAMLVPRNRPFFIFLGGQFGFVLALGAGLTLTGMI